MVRCESCGRPVMPLEQVEFEARKSGLDPDYFKTCPVCSSKKTVDTIRKSFDVKAVESGDMAEVAR